MTRVAIVWAVVGLVLALASQLLFEHFWVVAFLPLLVWAAIGFGLSGPILWSLRTPSGRSKTLRSGSALLAGALVFVPTMHLGNWGTRHIRMAIQRSDYDRIVERARGEAAESGRYQFDEVAGVTYILDSGPPLRVAFPWPGGIIDNWCGAVFDPSAEVMRINRVSVGTPAWRDEPITRLFGGDLISCRQLDAPYYACCFT